MENKKGIKLKCKFCGNIWHYVGEKKVMAMCTDCMKRVKIEDNKIE